MRVKRKKQIFIICPVRNVDEATKRRIEAYVHALEKNGAQVHWPSRDTNQDDPIGTDICGENRQAIYEADEVHIWYDSNSKGSIFDFGMVFAFDLAYTRTVILINPEDVQPTPHKSFQNVLLALVKASS